MKTLKTYSLISFFILASCIIANAQGTWTQRPNVFTSSRAGVVGFSIEDKGYFGTGWDFTNQTFYDDFWEWNPANNAWTQKASFAGTPRGDAAGFAIGNKGYITTGQTANGKVGDLWEWNQPTNTWLQKMSLPVAMERGFAAGFAIGNKGYICGGYGVVLTLDDVWEWNQLSNTWNPKNNIPIGRAVCVSFVIDTVAYVGLGHDGSTYLDDLWQFNPTQNSWVQKAGFPGGQRGYASGFAVGNKGYAGTGYDITGNSYADFWSYDPIADMWTQKANYPHDVTDIDRASFSIGCHGYFGTGATDPGGTVTTFFNDFWEYTPDTCIITGISTVEQEPVQISPNPFSTELAVKFNVLGQYEIILYDLESKKAVDQSFTQTIQLNTAALTKGIYFYEIRNKNNIVKSGQLTKY